MQEQSDASYLSQLKRLEQMQFQTKELPKKKLS
mgnify:CR=1 FL=1